MTALRAGAQLDSLRRYLVGRPAVAGSGRGNVVIVAAGKGGVGVSTVAALLAAGAAGAGARTLLVDAADGGSTLALLLGLPAAPGLEALRGAATLADVAAPLAAGLSFLGAATDLADGVALLAAERRALQRRAAAEFGAFDLVVIDAGSRLRAVLDAGEGGAARVLAVTGAERVTCAAAYALVKTLEERAPSVRVDLVVNRGDGAAAYAAVWGAATCFLRREIALAGVIPEDPVVAAAANAGSGLAPLMAGEAGTAARLLSLDLLHSLAAASADDGSNRKV